MRLKFTAVALNDLKRLRNFIAVKNPDAARRYSERLQNSIKRLVDYPEMGMTIEELAGVRELVAGDYVVRYFVKNDIVYILKIYHKKEDR
ncbi:type II toxin-antitoxin system RelE/ParE family toxin [Bacterioplanoides sp.]|uniref:type II toxin-antitoxin system RelE/ParE family toxin n=1 Tax=Bacterioplanoides sp. TaxID=2066072 RepID=UPI003B007BA3